MVASRFPVGWSNYDDYAREAAYNNNISPSFFVQLLHNENGAGNPYAKNPSSSATGLGQFITSTANDYTVDGGTFDRTNPFQSIDVAASYVGDLVGRFIGKGQTTEQAYASAAKSYGDTAPNNPSAAKFQAKLGKALAVDNTSQLAQAGSGLVSNFSAGLHELVTNPAEFTHIYGGILAAGGSAIVADPGKAASSLADQASAGASTIAGAAQETTAKTFAPVLGLATALQSGTLWERVALVVLGLALIVVALTALGAKPLGDLASKLPPVIPV